MDRWDEIQQFRAETGVELFYGLNGLYHRPNKTAHMSTSNLEALLHYAKDHNSVVTSFELGNELGNGNYRADPVVLGQDTVRVREIINSIWTDGSPDGGRPMLVGPDSIFSPGFYKPFLDTCAPALNYTTYHAYVCGSTSSSCAGELTDPEHVHAATESGHATADLASQYPGLQAMAGEVGPAYGGGVPQWSDRYADMVWYTTSLGQLRIDGVQRFARSTLVGGDYELINRTTHEPHPSYFTAMLHSASMAGTVLSVDIQAGSQQSAGAPASHSGDLNAYASCTSTARLPANACVQPGAKGAATYLLSNIGGTALSVQVQGAPPAAKQCVWQVRSAAAATAGASKDDILRSDVSQWRDGSGAWVDLALGGAPGYEVPSLANPPAMAAGEAISLGAYEYAFVVVAGAGGDVCE